MTSEKKLATPAASLSSADSQSEIEEFVPRRFLSNGHLQTMAGNFLPRKYFLPEPESCVIQVDSEHVNAAGQFLSASHVLCHCHWQPDPGGRPTLLLVHGLEGSSSSQYVLGNASRAWASGCNVVRMNMRNCGGTEHLSSTLYHSGLSGDVQAVVRTLATEKNLVAFALVGYSMGGNLVLKLAGELGQAAPGYLKAVVGVSPVIELAIAADALHEPHNWFYERHFMRGLLGRFRRKAKLFPEIYSTDGIERIRTVRQFDDRITARYSGFLGADDYYYRAASARVLDTIAVPTLILHAADDPFIRLPDTSREAILGNPRITFVETVHGGHCAFLAHATGYDGYWAEKTLHAFVLARMDI